MKLCAEFWIGLGAGLLAGVAAAEARPCNAKAMKRQMGKSIHKLGIAVDQAVDRLVDELH